MASQKYHILKEYANGVMDEKGKFYPFKVVSIASDITGKPNIRYYIKSINISAQKAGASAAEFSYGVIKVKGEDAPIFGIRLCETFAASGTSVTMTNEPRIIGDIGASIDVTIVGTLSGRLVIAEIEEVVGEYCG